MAKNIVYLILLLFLNSGCRPLIEINGNSYRFLNATSLNRLRVMNDSVCSNRGSSIGMYEISRNDMSLIINSNSNSVFMFFLPSCPVLDVSGIKEVYDLCKNQKNVNLYLVSMTYEIGSINSLNKKLDNSSAIFILKDSDFSHKTRKANARLNKLWKGYDTNQNIENVKNYYDWVIIRNGEIESAHPNTDTGVSESIRSMIY